MKCEVPTADYGDYCALRCDSCRFLDKYQCSEEPDASFFRRRSEDRQSRFLLTHGSLSTSKDKNLVLSPSFFHLINLRCKVKGMTDRLSEIGRYYGMEMNVEKTKVMRISKQPSPGQIMTDQKQVENVE